MGMRRSPCGPRTATTASSANAPRILILTTFDLDEYVYEAMKAGASGFILKNVPPAKLVDAVRTVADGDALLARAENRVHAVRPLACGASRTRVALVARRERAIGEVATTRALQQIAANARHIAKLWRCTREQRLRQQRIAFADDAVVGELAVAHQCTHPHASVGELGDPIQRQAVDVNHSRGLLHVALHEVEQIGSAGEEPGIRIARERERVVHT